MATLYEIDELISNCIDQETGEILDTEALSALEIDREKKIEGAALWYKNLVSDAEAFKTEKDNFAQKEKAAKNKAESIKGWLTNVLQGDKFKTHRVSISYRSSESVQVDDIKAVPPEFLTVKEPEPNKTMIKQALNSGTPVPGCHIDQRSSTQIK